MNENEKSKGAYNYGRDLGYSDGFVDGYKAGVKAAEPKWTPVKEKSPKKSGEYIVCYINGDVTTDWYGFTDDGLIDGFDEDIVAWQPLPKSYEESER